MRGTVAKRLRRQAVDICEMIRSSSNPNLPMQGTRRGLPHTVRNVYRALKNEYKGKAWCKPRPNSGVDVVDRNLRLKGYW